MLLRTLVLFTAAGALAAPVLAQQADAPAATAADAPATGAAAAGQTKVYRLSDEQIEAAKEAGARRPETAALLPSPERDAVLNNSLYDDPDARAKRRIHGEAGFFVGTGGARGFYGSTVIPLGETGTLGLAFSQSQGPGFGYGYGGYGYGGYGFGGYGDIGGYGYPYPGLGIGGRGRIPVR